MVIVSPIAILLAVCLIVFLIETNAVAQRKTVVCRQQVNGGRRTFAVTLEDRWSRQSDRQTPPSDRSRVSQKAADGIAEVVVPLGKQRQEIPHLITALSDVPGLRDQLTFESTGRFLMASNSGACWLNAGVRPITGARSKRKPSTWNVSTQYFRHSYA